MARERAAAKIQKLQVRERDRKYREKRQMAMEKAEELRRERAAKKITLHVRSSML